jgi:hypothetical protein
MARRPARPTPKEAPASPGLPLEVDALVDVLRRLGAEVAIDERTAPRPEFVALSLAYGVVGAAERHAILAEGAARAAGVSIDDLGRASMDVYKGAACHRVLDALRLVEWRLTRTTQALQQLQLLDGPAGGPDPLGRTILLVAAALAGLLSATAALRDPLRADGDTAVAAHAVRQAITALDRAAQDARSQRVLADLLSLAG